MRSAGDGNQSIIGTKLVTLLGRSRVNFQFWPRFRLSLIGLGNTQYLHIFDFVLFDFLKMFIDLSQSCFGNALHRRSYRFCTQNSIY